MFFSKPAYRIIRIGLAVVFIVSGSIKLADLDAFAKIIQAFAILPFGLCYPAAVVISTAELVFGLGLFADVKGSLAGLLVMLLVFVFILGWAIHMGYDIDCGCFGPEDPEGKVFSSLKTSLVRDGFMIISIFYLYAWRRKNHHSPLCYNPLKKQEAGSL